MKLPDIFIQRITFDLGIEAQPFFHAMENEVPISIRVNLAKNYHPENLKNVAWCNTGYYLPERPVFTLDPLFHAGAYYVQEASSMFLEQALKQSVDLELPLKVLDLCAAPGGKSTHLASLLSRDSLLVSNEVIRTRAKILAENITKWGNPNVVATNNDPADFQRLPGFFDVVVVDAPCSGEGLFRKDPNAMYEWSEDNVALCASRQRRIVADVWDALKPGGHLVYSTCTYNRMENEDNLEWMENEMGAIPLSLEITSFPEITKDNNLAGYHFYPHKTHGEGFFIAVLKKPEGEKTRIGKWKKTPLSKIPPAIQKEIVDWVLEPQRFEFWSFQDKVLAFPNQWSNELLTLIDKLSIVQAGTEVCEIKAKNLIPSHALALSTYLNKNNFTAEELTLSQALHFLKKEEIKPQGISQYLIATHQNIPLGFLKKAGNRYNNLYPKEWRIRMDIPAHINSGTLVAL